MATTLACRPSRALVSLNDGHDKIFVSVSTSVAHDSNVFANSNNNGDFVYSTGLSAEYTRRAGWIGVNANMAMGSSHFATLKGQDFNNPSFGLEFTKQSGRTTGSLTLSAARESRADAAVNVRSTSWNVPIGLNFKYPIVGTYTLSGSFGYSSRRYLNETAFASLQSYNASFDLFHILTTERDMLVGYRYRFNESSKHTSSTDHGFSLGINGKLLRGISGSLRVGYQVRIPRGPKGDEPAIKSWTISSPASFAISKRFNISGTVSKDLAITATDAMVDTTTAGIDGQYAFTSHWQTHLGSTFGDTRFLGDNGRVVISAGPPTVFGPQRHDDYVTWSWSLNYARNQHLNSSLTYSWFRNWSTTSFGDFTRSSWTLNMSTRW
jgi:hypothetical protein